MTKTFGAFGVTVQEGNTAMMDAQKIIDGLKTSPPCIIVFNII